MEVRERLRERVSRACAAMTAGLIERDEPARLLVLAVLAQEHVLLVGPPGTAKSELARRLHAVAGRGRYFERLLTKFSVPEEIFGPLSIRGLERDEYKRLTEGYLPTATVAFLDEIFNANSAILNALLTLLNEREFDNGASRERCPLATVVGASNGVGDGPELAALQDRFLFRCFVEPVSAEAFARLLELGEAPERGEAAIDASDVEVAQSGARAVRIGPAALHVLDAVRRTLAAKDVYVSDRRWRKVAHALRVACYVDGRDEVALQDAFLVPHCLWNRVEQREVVSEAFRAAIDSVLVDEPRRLGALAEAFQREIEKETAREELACNDDGQVLFADDEGRPGLDPYEKHSKNDKGELLFKPPHGLAERTPKRSFTLEELWHLWFVDRPRGMEQLEAWAGNPLNHVVSRKPALRRPARYSEEHIASRVGQVEAALADVRGYRDSIEALRHQKASLFPTSAPSKELEARMATTISELRDIEGRLEALVDAVLVLRQRAP